MRAKGYVTPAQARGLGVALLVNAAVLALLAIGPQPKLRLQPETPSAIILLQMVRPPPPKVVEPERTPETTPRPIHARPPAPSKPPPSASAAPVVAPPVLQAPATPRAGVFAPSGVTAPQGAGSEQAAAAMRHLLGCAAFTAGRRHDGQDCEAKRNGDPGHIDALTPERRLSLGPTDAERREGLISTNSHLHEELFGARGSTVRYGCSVKGGKWKCGTY